MNMVENMLDQAFKKLNPHEHPVLPLTGGYRMRRYQNILKNMYSCQEKYLDNAVVECSLEP